MVWSAMVNCARRLGAVSMSSARRLSQLLLAGPAVLALFGLGPSGPSVFPPTFDLNILIYGNNGEECNVCHIPALKLPNWVAFVAFTCAIAPLLPLHILACFLLSHLTLSCRHPNIPLNPSPSITWEQGILLHTYNPIITPNTFLRDHNLT